MKVPTWVLLNARRHKTTRLDCDGRGVFLFRAGKNLKVYDGRCPHQATNIPELALKGRTLTCPGPEWAFDAATGRCTANGDAPLTALLHKVAGGRALVHW
jgi:nitrite reductase/ring-hydroxylating ferredoxin subunit